MHRLSPFCLDQCVILQQRRRVHLITALFCQLLQRRPMIWHACRHLRPCAWLPTAVNLIQSIINRSVLAPMDRQPAIGVLIPPSTFRFETPVRCLIDQMQVRRPTQRLHIQRWTGHMSPSCSRHRLHNVLLKGCCHKRIRLWINEFTSQV